jgi:hypothetical protein
VTATQLIYKISGESFMSTIAKIFPGFASVVEMIGFQSGRECVYGEHIPGGVRVEQTTEYDEIEKYGPQWVIDCYILVTRNTLEDAWKEWQSGMENISKGTHGSYGPQWSKGKPNYLAAKILSCMREKASV